MSQHISQWPCSLSVAPFIAFTPTLKTRPGARASRAARKICTVQPGMTGRAKSTAAHSPSYDDTGGVSVAGLTKVYGPSPGLVALDNFTLDFPAGKCTVLLGPSGCGKTTVL